MVTQQSAAAQSAIDAPPLPSVEVTGTPSAPQPPVFSQGAGPSTAPIVVESSSSDEPMAQAPEQGVTASQMQHEEIRFKVEQDTPDNSLFSFAVALSDDEEVASRQVALSSILDDVRAKLASIRSLLQGDIGRLVEDTSPIRQLFGDVSGRVPEEAEEALALAAFIESMRIPVFRALRHMADRAKLAKTCEEEDAFKHQAQEAHRRIHFLEDSRPGIIGEIDRLKRRRAELAKEMEQVTKAISAEEKRLQELPSVIADLTRERQRFAHEALKLHRSASEVPNRRMKTNGSLTLSIRSSVGQSRLSIPFWVICKTLTILYEHLLSALTVLRDALPIYCLSYFRWDVSLPNFHASFSYKYRPRHFLLKAPVWLPVLFSCSSRRRIFLSCLHRLLPLLSTR
ncbi:uncharacterized protein [Setaria viridis]|uniref:uncharacterized protein n=1 Tax=Setaria viridis TaxID=4556 RepID=UPI003B3B2A79